MIRFGDEEFLAVLLDIREGESKNVAEKSRLNIQQLKIKIPEGGASEDDHLGTSEFPAGTDTLWSCIKFADVALYRVNRSLSAITGHQQDYRHRQQHCHCVLSGRIVDSPAVTWFVNVDNLHGYAGMELFEGKREMARQNLEATSRDTFFQTIAPSCQYLDAEGDKSLVGIAIADIVVVQFDGPTLNICAVPFASCYQNSMNILEDICPSRLICDIIGVFQNTVRHDNHRKYRVKHVPNVSSSLSLFYHRTKWCFRQSPSLNFFLSDVSMFNLFI